MTLIHSSTLEKKNQDEKSTSFESVEYEMPFRNDSLISEFLN